MKNSSIKPYIYIFIFQVITLILLAMHKPSSTVHYTIIFSCSVLILVGVLNMYIQKRLIGYSKHFMCVSMLFSIGILEIFRLDSTYGFKQIFWFIIGILAMYTAYLVIKNMKFYKKWYWFYVALIYILFIYTLLAGVTRYGSRNWISIFGHLFQPAEFIKAIYIMQLASLDVIASQNKRMKLINGCITFSYLVFLMLQKDLGSAAIMFSIFIAYLYAFEKNRWHYRASLLAFALFAVMGYFILSHVRIRFAVWLHPFKFFEQRGYQVVTALTAIANGSWFYLFYYKTYSTIGDERNSIKEGKTYHCYF